MQQLGLISKNEQPAPKIGFVRGFFRRQFQKNATNPQKTFDWVFGVILPIGCFVFDPIVFKGNAFGAAVLGDYKAFAYVLSFVTVMATSAWLIWGEKLKWINAFLAGLFLVSGIIAFAIGIVLLPISLIGLIILIGILGFMPLFSATVFLRNAFRAFQSAKPFLEKKVVINSFFLSIVLSAVIPFLLNVEIKQALDAMTNGDAQTIRANAQKLKFVAPLVNFDCLALRYHRSADRNRETEEIKAISEVYRELTGEDVEKNVRVLMD